VVPKDQGTKALVEGKGLARLRIRDDRSSSRTTEGFGRDASGSLSCTSVVSPSAMGSRTGAERAEDGRERRRAGCGCSDLRVSAGS
jgi:hypothetical protein